MVTSLVAIMYAYGNAMVCYMQYGVDRFCHVCPAVMQGQFDSESDRDLVFLVGFWGVKWYG